VCLKDIQRYNAHHDPITLHYMVAGCKYAVTMVYIFPTEPVFNCVSYNQNQSYNSGQSKRRMKPVSQSKR